MSSRATTTARIDPRRSGYTLVEMLIVCAVLAALAGMSWPAMRGVLGKARLQYAADELQSTLRKARVQAVRGGTAVVFRHEPGGKRYQVSSWDAGSENLNAVDAPINQPPGEFAADGDPAATDDRAQQHVAAAISPAEKLLPEGVQFSTVDEDVAAPGGEMELVSTAASLPPSVDAFETQWSEPIVFRPNGRSDDAHIRLRDVRGFVIDVTLRGLTGIVAASPPRRLNPLSDEPTISADEEPLRAVNETEAGR